MKEIFVLMCLASALGTCANGKVIVGHCDIYYAKKILNYFGGVEIRILVEK